MRKLNILYFLMKKIITVFIFFIFMNIAFTQNYQKTISSVLSIKSGYGYLDNHAHVFNAEGTFIFLASAPVIYTGNSSINAGDIIFSALSIFSVPEITLGVDVFAYEGLHIAPKAGFYWRPFILGKMGINVSTYGLNAGLGLSIPIKKKYLLEFLYEYNFKKFKYSAFSDDGISRYQLSLCVPIFTSYKTRQIPNKGGESKYLF